MMTLEVQISGMANTHLHEIADAIIDAILKLNPKALLRIQIK